MRITFWISLFIVFYTYLGYGILLYILIKFKRAFTKRVTEDPICIYPSCTLIVAAFNEEDYMRKKIENTLLLEYPNEKLQIIFVTDGSTDKTPEIISEYHQIKLLHSPLRKGKIDAVHRAICEVNTDVIIFTDANTYLNKDALKLISIHYQDQHVGAVAGEKRVYSDKHADASTAGEGIYWKYESILKKWDSELYSVVGAAGELFSIRKSLYTPVEPDTILDDFMISMQIAMKSYRIVYEPKAFATELASADIKEELKRKIRIAAGGIQAVVRLLPLLNVFKYKILSFQYLSHRVLRWTVAPFLLVLIFLLNPMIIFYNHAHGLNTTIYFILFWLQLTFYLAAFIGYLLEKKSLRVKVLFVPYYFCVMNFAVFAGIKRYFRNEQSVTWEKSKRQKRET